MLRFIEAHLEEVLRSDAEDILSETFLGLHQRRDRLQPDTSLHALLHTIAERRLADCIRTATAEKRDYRVTEYPDHGNGPGGSEALHDNGMSGHIADPEADPAIRDAKIEVNEMLPRLPPPEEQAVRLVDLDGHTIPSAADAANVPESTLKGRLQRGRQRLQEMATT